MAIDGGLRNLFGKHLIPQGIHWQAIETGSTGRGVPDANGCFDGVEFWVECKKCDGNTLQIEPEQVAWHMRRWRAGGNTYIAIRRKCSKGLRRIARDELWLFSGQDVQTLKKEGLNAKIPVLGKWERGPSKWDWEEVKNVLIGKEHGNSRSK